MSESLKPAWARDTKSLHWESTFQWENCWKWSLSRFGNVWNLSQISEDCPSVTLRSSAGQNVKVLGNRTGSKHILYIQKKMRLTNIGNSGVKPIIRSLSKMWLWKLMHPRFSMWWIFFLPVKKKWIAVTFQTRLESVLDVWDGCEDTRTAY